MVQRRLAPRARHDASPSSPTEHAREHGGKPWTYILVPHDAVTDNKTFTGLIAQHAKAD